MNYQNLVIYYIISISYFRNLPGGFLPSRLIAASRHQGPGGGLPMCVQRANALSQLEGRGSGITGSHLRVKMVNPMVKSW